MFGVIYQHVLKPIKFTSKIREFRLVGTVVMVPVLSFHKTNTIKMGERFYIIVFVKYDDT